MGHDPARPQDFCMQSCRTVALESVTHGQFAFIRVKDITPLLEEFLDEGLVEVRGDGVG